MRLKQASGSEFEILLIGQVAHERRIEKADRRIKKFRDTHVEKFPAAFAVQAVRPRLDHPCEGPNWENAVDHLNGIETDVITKKD